MVVLLCLSHWQFLVGMVAESLAEKQVGRKEQYLSMSFLPVLFFATHITWWQACKLGDSRLVPKALSTLVCTSALCSVSLACDAQKGA